VGLLGILYFLAYFLQTLGKAHKLVVQIAGLFCLQLCQRLLAGLLLPLQQQFGQ